MSQSDRALTSAFFRAPGHITTPMWVKAAGLSPAAQCLVEPLIAGAMRVHGDEAPTLDRRFLAWWIGCNRYDKVLPAALAELEKIGFLVIYTGPVNKDGKRQLRRDPKTRQAIPDTYAINVDVPEAYRGPRNLAEAYTMFLADRDDATERHAQSNSKTRAISIPRTRYERIEESQVGPVPPTEGTGRTPAEGCGTEPDVFAGRTHTPAEGYGHTPDEGYGPVSAGRTRTPAGGYVDREREEEPLRGSSDRSKEAAPPVFAGPDAAAPDDGAVRQLVRRFPWKQRGVELSVPEADSVVAAIKAAMRDHGLTLEQAQAHGLAALGRATGGPRQRVVYVANAFSARHVRAAFLEPLSEDTLPLPDEADPTAGRVEAQPQAVEAPDPHRPACDTCQAREGESNLYRTVIGEDDRLKPCPACRPETTPVTA